MQVGLASGLRQEQVASFLSPRLLRGIADPFGGGGLLAYLAEEADPTRLAGLARYASAPGPVPPRPMEAQGELFAAFPELVVVYQSLAGAAPVDEGGAVEMLELARSGYRPAQRTIDRILSAGNAPRAGARTSGSVADGVRPEVYDRFVSDYRGPLSPEAASAVANRMTYLAWVDAITSWVEGGSPADAPPSSPTFIGTLGPASPERSIGSGARCEP
jgi:hypothetical protein